MMRTPTRSPGRPPLPVDRVIAAALELLETEGAVALSMRRLAEHLGSGTATLYRHFASRRELLATVVDHVFVEIDPGVLGGASWQDDSMQIARSFFEVLRRRPSVAPLLLERVPVGEHAMAYRERLLAVLLAGGFTPKRAAQAYATLSRYVLGFAIQLEGASREGDAPFACVDAARFPATARASRFLPVPLEKEFAFGLEALVRGLSES